MARRSGAMRHGGRPLPRTPPLHRCCIADLRRAIGRSQEQGCFRLRHSDQSHTIATDNHLTITTRSPNTWDQSSGTMNFSGSGEPAGKSVRPGPARRAPGYTHLLTVQQAVGLHVCHPCTNFLGHIVMALMDASSLLWVSVQVSGVRWGVLRLGFSVGGLILARQRSGRNGCTRASCPRASCGSCAPSLRSRRRLYC